MAINSFVFASNPGSSSVSTRLAAHRRFSSGIPRQIAPETPHVLAQQSMSPIGTIDDRAPLLPCALAAAERTAGLSSKRIAWRAAEIHRLISSSMVPIFQRSQVLRSIILAFQFFSVSAFQYRKLSPPE